MQRELKIPITIRLPAWVRETVERDAKRERRSVSSMLNKILDDWVEAHQSPPDNPLSNLESRLDKK